MTPLDEAIEELTAMTKLGAIPEQQRRILGDVIGKIRLHQNQSREKYWSRPIPGDESGS